MEGAASLPRPAPAPPPLASPRRPCGACAASSLRSSLPAPRLATLAAPRLVVARGVASQRLFFHLPLIRWGLLRPRAPRLGGCRPSTPPRGSAPSTPHGAPAPCPPPGLFAPDPAKITKGKKKPPALSRWRRVPSLTKAVMVSHQVIQEPALIW